MGSRKTGTKLKLQLKTNDFKKTWSISKLYRINMAVYKKCVRLLPIYGAACANLLRTFHEVPPTNFSNTAVDGHTRLNVYHTYTDTIVA